MRRVAVYPIRESRHKHASQAFYPVEFIQLPDRYQTMTEVIADLEVVQSGGALSATASSGVAPFSEERNEEPAINLLVKSSRHIDFSTITTGRQAQIPVLPRPD